MQCGPSRGHVATESRYGYEKRDGTSAVSHPSPYLTGPDVGTGSGEEGNSNNEEWGMTECAVSARAAGQGSAMTSASGHQAESDPPGIERDGSDDDYEAAELMEQALGNTGNPPPLWSAP